MPSKIKPRILSLLLLLPAAAFAQDTQPTGGGSVAVPASLTALANAPADAVNDAANLSFPGMQALQTVWFAQRVNIERAQLDELRAQTARLAELRDQTAKLAAAIDSLATWAKQPAPPPAATTQPAPDSAALVRIAVALEAIQASQATQAQRMVMLQGNAGRIEGATTRLSADFAAAFKPVVTTQPATTQPVGGAK